MNFEKNYRENIKRFCLFFLFLSLLSVNKLHSQSTVVTGLITDQDKMPLYGVNIVEKGAKSTASSGFDGKYSIKVSSPNATLQFSYVSFETKTIALNGRNSIDVALQPESQSIKEIVVVGYGKVKKGDLTGAVGSLDTAKITERGTTSAMESIQGNVAGVQVNQSNGRASGNFSMVIRGKSTMSGFTTPLYVVDGIVVDDIEFLNPQDILRMDVQKDASSTAIFGSRATNGVVIITTKSASSAKSGFSVSFDSYVGVRETARLPKFMNGSQWMQYNLFASIPTGAYYTTTGTQMENTAYSNNAGLRERVNNGTNFDWYDAILKPGIQKNNYVSISSKNDNLSYNIGLGYQTDEGNMDKESIDKYNLKLALGHKFGKFELGFNSTLTKTITQVGSAQAMTDAFRFSPLFTAYDANGNLYQQPGTVLNPNGSLFINKTSSINPLLEIASTTDQITRYNVLGNMFLQYKLNKWFTLKSTYSLGFDDQSRAASYSPQSTAGFNDVLNGFATSGTSINNKRTVNYTVDNQFNIEKTLADKHNFALLGLQTLFRTVTERANFSSARANFYTDIYNAGSGLPSTYVLGSNYAEKRITSYALRFNYDFKKKYLLTLTQRWDGASVFSDGNKWGSFPSAAVAWKVTEENFMKNQKVVSEFKLRAGYGKTGNNQIDSYATIFKADTPVYYDFNGVPSNGYYPSKYVSSVLNWETTTERNIGLDFGFLKNRITGSVDLYKKLSEDLLMQQQLPLEFGFKSLSANVGSVENKGVEASLNTKIVSTDLINWDLGFTFTQNKNTIKSLYGQTETNDIPLNLFIGESIDAVYNYEFAGIWQANEKVEAARYGQTEGQAKVRDYNGDGKITPDDRHVLGNSNPQWSGGVNTKLRIGNVDISASAITNQGVYVYSYFHSDFLNFTQRGRQKLDVDYYVPENIAGVPVNYTNEYPMPRNEGIYWNQVAPTGQGVNGSLRGVGYYRDASFVKIKNISLGYTFNNEVVKKFKLNYLRLYANVLNPFVFTKYDGYDPEWAGATLSQGGVGSITYQMGLNIKF